MNIISLLLSKLLRRLGYRHDASVIPNGLYCYTPDYVSNNPFGYHVKPCPYYKIINKHWNGCKYLGIITDDPIFNDQCKMCSENYE